MLEDLGFCIFVEFSLRLGSEIHPTWIASRNISLLVRVEFWRHYRPDAGYSGMAGKAGWTAVTVGSSHVLFFFSDEKVLQFQ